MRGHYPGFNVKYFSLPSVVTFAFTFLSPSNSPSLSFPASLLHSLCIAAKQSNGCWHIQEPCCPTLSRARGPSRWLGRVQLGSGRDEHTKAISVATNGRSENPAICSVHESNREYLFIFKGQRLHCRRIAGLLMWDVSHREGQKNKSKQGRVGKR